MGNTYLVIVRAGAEALVAYDGTDRAAALAAFDRTRQGPIPDGSSRAVLFVTASSVYRAIGAAS